MDNRTGQWQNYVAKLDNTPQISGPATFCNSAIYTVSNLLPNTTVTWSATPSGIVNLTQNGNQVTATKVTQGNFTLSASVNQFPNGIGSLNLTTIPQTSSISYNMSGACSNGIQTWFLSATPNMTPNSNWNWTVDNLNSGINIQSPHSQSTYATVSKGGGVSVTYTDACGETSQRNGVTIYSPCARMFAISPNPATESVNILPITVTGTATTSSSISQINIYDMQNILKIHTTYHNVKSTNINVSKLQTGVYVIEIIDGTYKERQELQVLR
ncbi:MAG: T9SS type A sorting domain-containing protein [Bacteroidetes bacterium]|nr:T9SS type A sorting domain-containing protein [Bacteroidota bacterium]MBS1609427.1 T9SS type A sorting domain-containing protein [Bacteroidota bacterium]